MNASDTLGRTGANILLDVLESEGCEYIFGNPGTTELPLIDALIDRPHLHYVLGLQEATVVAMADGYAQASGKPAFVNLHTAGGLGHGLGNLLNAFTSGTPLVVTAGQQDSRHAITDPLLQGDLVSIARPACKWAAEVTSPDQIPILMHRAFQDSQATPRGPVFLSLPMDVMEERSTIRVPQTSHVDRRPVAGSLAELAVELTAVEPGKVAIIAGDEISQNDAYKEVVHLAELLAAPVFGSSWPAHIPFPTSHYLWQGNLPTRASGIAEAMQGFDCVFALGGKSFITILYSEASALPEACELFQLSVDGRDLGRTFRSKLSMVGDIELSLKALNALIEKRLAPRAAEFAAARDAARQAYASRKRTLHERAAALADNAEIHPLVAARILAESIGATPIVDEAIATASHLRSFLNNGSTRQYSFLRGGALGGRFLARARPPTRRVARRRRRRDVFTPGAVDRGERGSAGHVHRDQQPRVQRAEEFHALAAALRVGANRTVHRHGHHHPGHRLHRAGAIHGGAGAAHYARGRDRRRRCRSNRLVPARPDRNHDRYRVKPDPPAAASSRPVAPPA